MGYNYYPKTRIFIRQLIKLCLFCPITVTRSTSNVPLSHIGFCSISPCEFSEKLSHYPLNQSYTKLRPISTFTVASSFLYLRKLTFYFLEISHWPVGRPSLSALRQQHSFVLEKVLGLEQREPARSLQGV